MLTEQKIRERISFHEAECRTWREILAKKSCQTCEHWTQRACNLAGGVEPPPDVQRTGCPSWAYDLIPF
jgi:hypothetical protein